MMRLPYFLSLPIAATLSVLNLQHAEAQLGLDQSQDEIKIGGATVVKVLERLGAKMEHGVPSDVMTGYSRHFGLVDSDGDGRHSTVEYVDNSNYMTPRARRGIFKAADHDKDDFVSKAEYVINRIVTDEGKAIVQAMDDDKDGVVQRAEFIFDPDGKIVVLRDWSSPGQLRADLEKLDGPGEKAGSVADLKFSDKVPAPAAARGIVPRLDVPEGLQSIKLRLNAPEKDKPANPHYSKLQAKADEELLKTGKGKLYLSFHLDPVYKVHWNNLVAPIEYEIKTEGETRVSPKSGKGPKVKAAADIDPREFLLNIEGGDSVKPLALTVRYFACNDDKGWCKLVTQTYLIHLEAEAEAGRGGREGPFDARGRPGQGGPPGGGGLLKEGSRSRDCSVLTTMMMAK